MDVKDVVKNRKSCKCVLLNYKFTMDLSHYIGQFNRFNEEVYFAEKLNFAT